MQHWDRTILDSLNIGIIILDETLKIAFINEWIKNRSVDSLNGKNFSEVCLPGHRILNAIEDCRKQGRSSLLSGSMNLPPLSLYHGEMGLNYNVIISRLEPDELKSPVLLQFIDTTQVHTREVFLRDKQIEIDIERMKAFNKERLASLGMLSTSLAHEINNPLAILQSLFKVIEIKLKKNGVSIPEIDHTFLQGKATIMRISELINSIKNLGRTTDSMKFVSLSFHEVIEDILPVIKSRANMEHVEIRYRISEDSKLQFDGVRNLLGQVLINLFNNSFDHLKKHVEKWIDLSVESSADAIKLSFTDSGSGIPDEIREKIFLPFFTTKDIGQGTGLGLSTSLKIIEEHQGSLKLDDRSSNTRFVIIIPLKRTINAIA